jgi:hypothetical protein
MDEVSLGSIITALIEKGVEATPIISTVLLIICLYYYRKDTAASRQETRADLIASTQAIERNTAAMTQMTDLIRNDVMRNRP